MNMPAEPTLDTPQPAASAGAQLKAAREYFNLSVEDVAAHLNLSADTVAALEEDDYSRLPGATFAIGYVRAYAKLLRLDFDTVAAGLVNEPTMVRPGRPVHSPRANTAAQTGTPTGLAFKGRVPAEPARQTKSGWKLRVLVLVCILLGLAGLVLSKLPELRQHPAAVLMGWGVKPEGGVQDAVVDEGSGVEDALLEDAGDSAGVNSGGVDSVGSDAAEEVDEPAEGLPESVPQPVTDEPEGELEEGETEAVGESEEGGEPEEGEG